MSQGDLTTLLAATTTITSSTTTSSGIDASPSAGATASKTPQEAEQNTSTAPTANQSLEDIDLVSHEQLPEDWPEEFPGILRYAPEEPPNYQLQFDSNDIALLNNLSNLAPGALIDEIKAMRAIACMLTIEEEKEKARGRILSVLLN